MKYVRSLLVLLLFSLIVLPLSAQDEALTETYVDEVYGISFDYPDGWTVDARGDEATLFPDSDDWNNIEDVSINFLFYNDEVEANLGISADMGAEEALGVIVDLVSEQGLGISADDIQVEQFNDNLVATIELEIDIYTVASIVETPNGLILVQLMGPEDQVDATRDVYFALLATIEIPATDNTDSDDEDENEDEDEDSPADGELSETFTDETGNLTFSYPDGWDVEQIDTSIYLTNDNAEGFIEFEFEFLTEDIQDNLGIEPDMTAEEGMTIVVESAIDDGLELSTDDIVVQNFGNNIGATIEINVGDEIIATVVETENGLILFQVMGSVDEVDAIRDVYYAMIETIAYTGSVPSDNEDEVVDVVAETDNVFDLDESYTNDDGNLIVLYPDGWDVEEDDGELIFSPDDDDYEDIEDVTINIVFETDRIEADTGLTPDLDYSTFAFGFIAQLESIDLEIGDPDKTLLGDYRVIRFDVEDFDGEIIQVSVIDTSGGLLVAALIGPDEQREIAELLYLDMLANLEYTGGK